MFKIKSLPKYAQNKIKYLFFEEERGTGILGTCKLKTGDSFVFVSRRDLLNQIKEKGYEKHFE